MVEFSLTKSTDLQAMSEIESKIGEVFCPPRIYNACKLEPIVSLHRLENR
jgi:hypothetical protein